MSIESLIGVKPSTRRKKIHALVETLEKLVKCWQDSVAGNRHWGLQAAKQSDPQIMLCMETMKMSKADMNKGFFHIVQPLGFGSDCLGLSCHAVINANVCAPLCQHGRAMKRSLCVEIRVIFSRSVTAFWKLLPSNRSGINHYLYVHLHPSAGSICCPILGEKASLTLCTEAKATLWHTIFL